MAMYDGWRGGTVRATVSFTVKEVRDISVDFHSGGHSSD